jgi:hypothetical protein
MMQHAGEFGHVFMYLGADKKEKRGFYVFVVFYR